MGNGVNRVGMTGWLNASFALVLVYDTIITASWQSRSRVASLMGWGVTVEKAWLGYRHSELSYGL
jgi:hypothetical protein